MEYRLSFHSPDIEAVARVLRLNAAAREGDTPGRFELGAYARNPELPEATVIAEPGGVYFCDHCCGTGEAHLGRVIVSLVGWFGPVTVEEL